MRWLVRFCLVFLSYVPMAQAQEPLTSHTPSGFVVVIDTERLFRGTLFGQRIIAELDLREAELRAENQKITEALTAEEKSLTERRSTMDAEVFRTEAAEFDARVQGIRRSREAASSKYEADRVAAPRQFLVDVRNIIGNLMVERGAVAILDKRGVFLSLDAIDITADAIARIDAQLGDGTPPTEN